MPIDFGDLDFTDVERKSFINFEGPAELLLTDLEWADSNDKQSSNLWISYIVDERGNAQEHIGKSGRSFINVGPKNKFQVREFLEKVLGIQIEGAISQYLQSPKDLVGQRVGAVFGRDGIYYKPATWFTVAQ